MAAGQEQCADTTMRLPIPPPGNSASGSPDLRTAGRITVPAHFAVPARKPTPHLPAQWPSQIGWKILWHNIISYSPAIARAG